MPTGNTPGIDNQFDASHGDSLANAFNHLSIVGSSFLGQRVRDEPPQLEDPELRRHIVNTFGDSMIAPQLVNHARWRACPACAARRGISGSSGVSHGSTPTGMTTEGYQSNECRYLRTDWCGDSPQPRYDASRIDWDRLSGPDAIERIHRPLPVGKVPGLDRQFDDSPGGTEGCIDAENGGDDRCRGAVGPPSPAGIISGTPGFLNPIPQAEAKKRKLKFCSNAYNYDASDQEPLPLSNILQLPHASLRFLGESASGNCHPVTKPSASCSRSLTISGGQNEILQQLGSQYREGHRNQTAPESCPLSPPTPPAAKATHIANKKRTKTGCFTHRARKLKCDEAKPTYTLCERSREPGECACPDDAKRTPGPPGKR
ncbi:hypothetical protein EJ06DRAFT_547843 [Trichodelitschia bisporula]|uniref:Zn(2)-C6 fungal-type domain-containing protein n=1 Tax=Trichodelitschia bisporula TaxID=703511 RepID=A0A6G1I307_9PEZI|nr:hypothetical protein EJ06DRAFT_547843 [Trichodelitschia bisporula]